MVAGHLREDPLVLEVADGRVGVGGRDAELALANRLGYRPNGDDLRIDAHGRRRVLRFVLEVDDRPPDLGTGVVLEGLDPCRALLGADPGGSGPG